MLYHIVLDPVKEFFFCSIKLISPFEILTYEDISLLVICWGNTKPN